MAINTAQRRFNFLRFGIKLLPIGLPGALALPDISDRENGTRLYIGVSYSPPAVNRALYSKLHQGPSFGF